MSYTDIQRTASLSITGFFCLTESESSGRHARSVVVAVRVFLHQQPLRFQSVRGDGTLLDLLLLVPPTQETQDALKRVPHLRVATRVDDGVDQRVAFGQDQAVLLIFQHMAACALQPIQQQDDQPGSPANHKGT